MTGREEEGNECWIRGRSEWEFSRQVGGRDEGEVGGRKKGKGGWRDVNIGVGCSGVGEGTII